MTLEEKINVLKANNFELGVFPDYQNDKEVVLVAVQHDSRNLKYASDELKRDDEILSTAISNLDSEYWRISKSGWQREDTYDVDRFLDDMEINVDVLKGKSKTAEVLIDSGYFDYDNIYDQGLNRPRLGYKDIFGEDFIPKISENGMQLEGTEEFENLLKEYIDLDYKLDNEIDYEEEYVEYCKTRAEQAKIRHRIVYLVAKCSEWSKTASVLEKISVNAITDDGTTIKNMHTGPIGALLGEVLADNEIMSDEDLKRKFELFQEKCTVVHNGMTIRCDWKKGQDGNLICTEINGASEIISSNCKIASVDFETGRVRNYANSIRPDWVIDEKYIDKSVIDQKLTKTHSIEEVEDGVSDRRAEGINEVITRISKEMDDKSKEYN